MNILQCQKPVKVDSFPSSSAFFRYNLKALTLWSMKLREDMAKAIPLVTLIPSKSGEGMKYSEFGVIQTLSNTKVPKEITISDLEITLTPIPEEEFNKVKKASMNKVFFKGFPFHTKKGDVKTVFEPFGDVKYIYFMCEPKKTKHPCKMGYVVFDSRNAVDNLFALGDSLLYNNHTITFEEYHNTKKSRRELNPKTEQCGLSKGLPSETKAMDLAQTRDKSLGLGNTASARTIQSTTVPQKAPLLSKSKFSSTTFTQAPGSRHLEWLTSVAEVARNSACASNLRFHVNLSACVTPSRL